MWFPLSCTCTSVLLHKNVFLHKHLHPSIDLTPRGIRETRKQKFTASYTRSQLPALATLVGLVNVNVNGERVDPRHHCGPS